MTVDRDLVLVESEAELRPGLWVHDVRCSVCRGRPCWLLLTEKGVNVDGWPAWTGVGCGITDRSKCVRLDKAIASRRLYRLKDPDAQPSLETERRREVTA